MDVSPAKATVAPAAKAGAGAGNNMPSRSASSGYDPASAGEKAFEATHVAGIKALEDAAAGAGAAAPKADIRAMYLSADGTMVEGLENPYKLPGDIGVGLFVRGKMYDVEPHEPLGRGAYGSVYKLNFDSKSFVLKVINNKMNPNKILREIEFLIALKGKWFAVQLIAAGIRLGGDSYILYPYVEGDTLEEMLIKDGFVYGDLTPTGKKPNVQEKKDLLHIYNRLIDATYELHQMGIIHHDIKHSNIWITGDGEPFFLDFGLSAHLGERVGWRGTRGFMRMNRYRDDDRPPATANINWYALGKTLEVFNPNTRKRGHHIILERPGITNNIVKTNVLYQGGRRTRRKQYSQKKTTRRLRRKL